MLNSFAVHTYNTTGDIVTALSNGEVTASAELSAVDGDLLSSDLVYEKANYYF